MDILTKNVFFEETIKGSVFLSELIPCKTQAEAREIIKAQKQKYADSTHVVHAFIVGQNAEVMGMSDDGEPQGTAGRPVLDVLKGSGCTNVILTVTRWFGGTLLGTGGLVKAYSGGAKSAIEKARTEGAFSKLVEKKAFACSCDYALYNQIKSYLTEFNISDLKEEFKETVSLSGSINQEYFASFSKILKDLSKGKIKI